uniref:Geranylgeranyl transferase type-2 subunit alpha n=1 Tax=Petromyzon marinus TaxID=7757 RepID=A0AAJ7WJM8_PETMA|nr:geranylgeranyl transferase type-2 subunit alpha [Petromyzon marinus]
MVTMLMLTMLVVVVAEFELVQNAIFTDPDDQSAWLYHRWLLGRAEQAESVSCLYVSQSLQLALVVFTRPINVLKDEQEEVVLCVDGKPALGSWVTPDRRNRHSLVWLCLLQDALRGGESVRVHWGDRPPKECVLGQGGGESWIRDEVSEVGGAALGAGLSPELDSALLQEQLHSCTELLQMEPRNKWCLLVLVLLMRALDPLSCQRQCLGHLDTLAGVDPGRCCYYRDARSRLLLANAVLTVEYADTRVLALPGRALSSLFHLEQLVLVTHLNLSNNSLHCLPRTLSCLQSLQVVS